MGSAINKLYIERKINDIKLRIEKKKDSVTFWRDYIPVVIYRFFRRESR